MTAATDRLTTNGWTVDSLRRLDARELRKLVLDEDGDPELWALLTGDEFQGDTAVALAAARRDIGIQLATRRRAQDWRPKGLDFQRRVDERIAAFERATGLMLENAANLGALIKLAQAIAAHRAALASEDGLEPEPYDLALWAALGQARLTTNDGEIIPLAPSSVQPALEPA